jgi:hypothetical protein
VWQAVLTIEHVKEDRGGIQVGGTTGVVSGVLPSTVVDDQCAHCGVRTDSLHLDVSGTAVVVENTFVVMIPEDVGRFLQ